MQIPRREELCNLQVGDLQKREGVLHLAVRGKGSRLDYLPLTPFVLQRIDDYLEAAGHGGQPDRALFQPVKNSTASFEAAPDKLAVLFKYLSDQNAVNENPVTGVERPAEGSNEGKSPALSDQEASALLDAPDPDTLKGPDLP